MLVICESDAVVLQFYITKSNGIESAASPGTQILSWTFNRVLQHVPKWYLPFFSSNKTYTQRLSENKHKYYTIKLRISFWVAFIETGLFIMKYCDYPSTVVKINNLLPPN